MCRVVCPLSKILFSLPLVWSRVSRWRSSSAGCGAGYLFRGEARSEWRACGQRSQSGLRRCGEEKFVAHLGTLRKLHHSLYGFEQSRHLYYYRRVLCCFAGFVLCSLILFHILLFIDLPNNADSKAQI